MAVKAWSGSATHEWYELILRASDAAAVKHADDSLQPPMHSRQSSTRGGYQRVGILELVCQGAVSRECSLVQCEGIKRLGRLRAQNQMGNFAVNRAPILVRHVVRGNNIVNVKMGVLSKWGPVL